LEGNLAQPIVKELKGGRRGPCPRPFNQLLFTSGVLGTESECPKKGGGRGGNRTGRKNEFYHSSGGEEHYENKI